MRETSLSMADPMISQKEKYALRALSALASGDGKQPRQISEIAASQSIPKKFLEQILLDLKREGIVRSLRGKQGEIGRAHV